MTRPNRPDGDDQKGGGVTQMVGEQFMMEMLKASSGPLNGVLPTPAFYQALLKARQDPKCKSMVRDKETDPNAKQKWKFSKTEDWLEIARDVLSPSMLVATQSSSIELLPFANAQIAQPFERIRFEVVYVLDGTGKWYHFDWPLWGEVRGGAEMGSRGLLTLSWKYFLRSLLQIPQTDGEGDEIERHDPHRLEPPAAAGYPPGVIPVGPQQAPWPQAPGGMPFNPAVSRAPDPAAQWGPAAPGSMPPFNPAAPGPHAGGSGLGSGGPYSMPPFNQAAPGPHAGNTAQGRPGPYSPQPWSPQTYPGVAAAAAQAGYPMPYADQHVAGGISPQGTFTGHYQQPGQYQQPWQPPPPLAPQPPPGWQPPVQQDPVVQAAMNMLGATPANMPTEPNPAPPGRAPAQDGLPEPSDQHLLQLGWEPSLVRQIGAMGADEVCPDGLRETFLNQVNKHFGNDAASALAAWQGTGYVAGEVDTTTGQKKRPKVCAMRRYMAKLDRNQKTAAAAAQ